MRVEVRAGVGLQLLRLQLSLGEGGVLQRDVRGDLSHAHGRAGHAGYHLVRVRVRVRVGVGVGVRVGVSVRVRVRVGAKGEW